MAPYWEPGTQYNYGDIVEYEGVEYKIVQPHRSQGDWTPPVTPALWGRLQGGDRHREGQRGDECKSAQNPPNYGQQQECTQRKETDQSSYGAPATQPAEEKHWYDMDDGTKKKLEIGGGIAAGIAAIGAGVYAYKRHEQHVEERRTHAWSSDNWITESQDRTRQWRAGQYNAPVAWVWGEGHPIPHDAIQGGEENGDPLFICRAYHEGAILVGKASREGAVIGFKKEEIQVDKYEILVGSSRAVRWVNWSGQLNVEKLHARPVEGGREPDGSEIYIAQAPYHNSVYPGKACEVYGDGCFVPCNNTEKKVKEYAILCYASG